MHFKCFGGSCVIELLEVCWRRWSCHSKLDADDEVGEDLAKDGGQRGPVHLKQTDGGEVGRLVDQLNHLVNLLLRGIALSDSCSSVTVV